MRKQYFFLAVCAAIALSLTQNHAAQAQTASYGTTLVAPFAGDTLYADSSGHKTVSVQSGPYVESNNTGHFVKFYGPLNGHVTWDMGISAGFGSGPSGGFSTGGDYANVPIQAAHAENTGSDDLSLTDPTKTRLVEAACYGDATFDSTTRHGSQAAFARATVYFTIPGRNPFSGGSNVNFTIVYP